RTRTVGARPDRYSTHASHHVRVVSHKGLERYCERVGFLAGSRLEAAKEHVPDEAPEQSWVVPHAAALMSTVLDAMPAGAEGRPSPYAATRKSLLRYDGDERHPTATGYERQSASPQLQDVLPELGYDEHYVRVVGVEEAGRS